MEILENTDSLIDVAKVVENTLKIPSGKLDVDASFESFGLDSIIAMELLTNLSKKFKISITPAQFTDVNNVRELADHINSAVSKLKSIVASVSGVVAKNSVATPSKAENTGSSTSKILSNAPKTRANFVKSNGSSNTALIEYISKTYSIDVRGKHYKSLDDMVDFLIEEHFDVLSNHYDIFQELAEFTFEDPSPDEPGSSIPIGLIDVAIVGMSCNFPDAPNLQTFWKNLNEGKSSIREIPKSRWDWEVYYSDQKNPAKSTSKWGSLIADVSVFDPEFFDITPKDAVFMDPQERLLLQEAYRAFEDAGVSIDKIAGSNTGVFIGYEYSEYEQFLRKNYDKITGAPRFTSSSPTYYLANRLSYLFDLRGPSESININCASSAVAINRAYYSIINGESSMAIAGGVCLNLFADDYIASSQYGMLSPDGTCGVFDDSANGFTRGEGVGVVVLKSLADAKRDNDQIYGVIKSCHQNNRGAASFISEIKHESITDVLSNCYKKASINPDQINYIEVDGYSTKWGDSFEFEGIKNVFSHAESAKKQCALGSLKGNIGHLEPASGMASFIKVALSLHNKKFPATISKKKINEFIDIESPSNPLYIADSPIVFDSIREKNDPLIRAGINSFADSGVNVHILLEEYEPLQNKIREELQKPHLLILSAKNPTQLIDMVDGFITFLPTADRESFNDIAYTLQVGRAQMAERVAIICNSIQELGEKLNLIKTLGISDQTHLEDKGIFYGNIEKTVKNPFVSLITTDMAMKQVEQSLESAQWQQIALLWTNGVSIPWEIVWKRISVKRTSLPGYPFSQQRYWPEIDTEVSVGINPEDVHIKKTNRTDADPIKNKTSTSASEYVPPTTAKEKKLVEIWSSILECDQASLSIKDNFLDQGGDSQTALKLISTIKKEFGQNLPLTILFSAPDIYSLSKVISTEVAAISEILIPMQTKGTKPPIFFVPGAGGSVVSLSNLSKALGDDQPFYGFQAGGLEGQVKLNDGIEKIAEANLIELEKLHAEGPYNIAGYSNGGIVAFEMVRQLLLKDKEVNCLLLLDCLAPSLRVQDELDEMVSMCKTIAINNGTEVELNTEDLRALSDDARSEHLYGVMKNNGFDMTLEQFKGFYNIAMTSERSCRNYKSEKLSIAIETVLINATESYQEAPKDYGWNDLLSRKPRIHEVKADHFSLIEKIAVKDVAKKITAALEKK
jgi:3-oxoacyl-(acyl-carrier-protein) synthase/thioesterase domain-containing protein/acyl carrier protein